MMSKLRRKKIGRRYEYYVAWLMRGQGWEVAQRTNLGVDDEGIDIIATKDNRTAYVQCKGWSVRKPIHENIIDHLYGSTVYQVGADNLDQVEMMLFTSSILTEHALQHADKLGVTVIHESYPIWRRQKQHI